MIFPSHKKPVAICNQWHKSKLVKFYLYLKSFSMITIYTDGATEGHNGPLGTVKFCGIGFYCPDKNVKYSKRVEGGSNNEAEFMALIAAMKWASLHGFRRVRFLLDSQIVVNRANGRRPKGKHHHERMNKFQDLVFELKREFDEIIFAWVPRHENYVADRLSKQSLLSNYANQNLQT